MYVCMYICIYIPTYIHTHIHTYIHTHTYTHTYINTYTHIHTKTHIYIHTITELCWLYFFFNFIYVHQINRLFSPKVNFVYFIIIQTLAQINCLLFSFYSRQLTRDTWSLVVAAIFRRVEGDSRTAPTILAFNNVSIMFGYNYPHNICSQVNRIGS
jgi:hypothetical protein